MKQSPIFGRLALIARTSILGGPLSLRDGLLLLLRPARR